MQRNVRVAGWLVQPSLGRITKAGLTVPVRAKVMDLLVYLAQHPGEVVSKDVLLRDVWGTDAISESALTRTIAEMREALGDDVEQPSILETIPKRGYRLVAPVVFDPGDDARDDTADHPTAERGGRPVWTLAGAAALLVAGVVWMTLRDSPVFRSPEAIGEARNPMLSRPVTTLDGVERDPSLSPDGSQVAFIWNNDLYVKAVDSGEPHRIASNVFETAWSRNGQWIATYRNVGQPGHHKLLLVSPTGGSEREIGQFYVVSFKSLDWSPDGDWIALTHKERQELAPGVFLVEIKTGKTQRITTPPPEANFDGDPNFSNGGRRLVFVRNFSRLGIGKFEIRTIGVDGTGEERVVALEGLPLSVGWAPDDRSLVLAWRTPDNLAGLWRVPLDGSPPSAYEVGENAWSFSIARNRLVYEQLIGNTQLWLASGPAAPAKQAQRLFRPGSRNDSAPQYSPDGRRVAIVSTKGRSAHIWVCENDGTQCVQLTYQGRAAGPMWSSNGKSIVYDNQQGNNDLYIVNADGGPPRALTNDTAPDGAPGFSRDGQWVYFNSKRNPDWRIFRVLTTGGIPQEVSTPDGVSFRETTDGWFYFSRAWIGTIERMRGDGSNRQILATGLQAPVAWTLWGAIPLVRRGDVIFKVDPQTRNLSEFWRLDSPSMSQTGVDRAGGCFDVSPDGRYVVYCKSESQGDIILVENIR